MERKWARELAVVGIHSGKFKGEKSTDGIREAVRRHGLRHPVANDADYAIWKAYAVRAWPTLWLVDPEGYLVGRVSGEGNFEVLDRAIAETVAAAERKGTLRREPVPGLAVPAMDRPADALAYPGKVAAGGDPPRIVVADTLHHRIVIADADGAVLDVAGTGEPGGRDGAFGEATFHAPRGVALDGDALWVADTGGHRIRRLDLAARTVSTVAGTGERKWKGGWFAGKPLATPLNSPWDLLPSGTRVLVAMAGDHRLWVLDTAKGAVGPLAGSGREDLVDGDLREAAFSQPSGLALAGEVLFVADSEDSAVRRVDLGTGRVSTLVGTGLFDFGDRDGTGDEVLLQHPLAVAWDPEARRIYVADTYNHRVKVLDPATRRARTLAGSGARGEADGPAAAAAFDEPSGLALLGRRLLVADTNNHAVRVLDLESMEVSTLRLRFGGGAVTTSPADGGEK